MPNVAPKGFRSTHVFSIFFAITLTWDPLPPEHRNGIITGYDVMMEGRENMSSTTTSVVLSHLSGGTTYTIRVAAKTAAGVGPFASTTVMTNEITSKLVVIMTST